MTGDTVTGGAQQILRVVVGDGAIEKLRDEGVVHFPLNDENSKIVELEYDSSIGRDDPDPNGGHEFQ